MIFFPAFVGRNSDGSLFYAIIKIVSRENRSQGKETRKNNPHSILFVSLKEKRSVP